MRTVPSAKAPSGAVADASDIGCAFGAVWPSFDAWPPLPDVCAKAVLAASAPTRAPTKTVRFMSLASRLTAQTAELKPSKYTDLQQSECHGRKPAQRLVRTISPLNVRRFSVALPSPNKACVACSGPRRPRSLRDDVVPSVTGKSDRIEPLKLFAFSSKPVLPESDKRTLPECELIS